MSGRDSPECRRRKYRPAKITANELAATTDHQGNRGRIGPVSKPTATMVTMNPATMTSRTADACAGWRSA